MKKNKKPKKRMIFFTTIFLTIPAIWGYNKEWMQESFELHETNAEIFEIREKHKIFEQVGERLKNHGLGISPSTFADYALIVSYCESKWNPKAKNSIDAQGIFQWTVPTREYLNLPKDITGEPFEKQATYLGDYLIATGKVRQISNPTDLHLLNFSPSNPLKSDTITGVDYEKNKALDLDENGFLSRNDLALFEKRCIMNSGNATLMGIWSKQFLKP